MMRLGVVLPQTVIGGDPLVVRDFAQAAEDIGYHHLVAYDHVLGANVANRPDWQGTYTSKDFFHDVFVLFGYIAGQTTRLELAPQVLILPQRQTALVAKQAASVDYLSGGRLRLGVGVGWNPVEYVGLGEDFHNRGRRQAEQVQLLRILWTEPHVTFKGQWHEIPDAGLNPLPVQRPIPIWFGGRADPTLRRIGQLGDGWITFYYPPGDEARQELDKLKIYAREAGRDPADIGLDAWVSMAGHTPEAWRAEFRAWASLGATHLTLNTAFARWHHQPIAGTGVDDHIAALRDYYEGVQDLLH